MLYPRSIRLRRSDIIPERHIDQESYAVDVPFAVLTTPDFRKLATGTLDTLWYA